jgi:hypothetical protein
MQRPFESSLCHGCAHKRDVEGKNSWFLLCAVSPQKYPRQPVATCPSFEPALQARSESNSIDDVRLDAVKPDDVKPDDVK